MNVPEDRFKGVFYQMLKTDVRCSIPQYLILYLIFTSF